MKQTTQIIDAFKRILKSRGITYRELAKKVGLSEASVKRLFSEQSFTLQRLEAFCDALEIDFFELGRLAKSQQGRIETLSAQQEKQLVKDPKLLSLFYLLYNDWQPQDVEARYQLSKPECIQLLMRLEKMGVINVLPNNKVQLRVSRNLRIRPDGAIRDIYGNQAMQDFLKVRFDECGGHFCFEFRELSTASVEILKRKMDHLAAEFNQLAELDSMLPAHKRKTIGMCIGLRPWTITFVSGLQERREAAT